MNTNNSFITAILLIITCTFLSSCKQFVFLGIEVDKEKNPLTTKKMPKTSADLFEPPIITSKIPNPDPDGAFADWATCLILIKEGHPHGNGKFHGNAVLSKAPWKQEELAIIHNTENGIKVEVDTASTATYLEKTKKVQGPKYIRIIGGSSKLWAICLRFYDKEGKLINDKILGQSNQYQIFFSISDLDDSDQPYPIMDVRYRGKDDEGNVLPPLPSKFFMDKTSFEARQSVTSKIFHYTYRDTWTDDDMSDGVRNLFNIKLLPPLTDKDLYNACNVYDQDFVGLKGHIRFDYDDGPIDPLDWNVKLTNGRGFRRQTGLLPQFYLAIRVMKCEIGNKAVIDPSSIHPDNPIQCISKKVCAPSDAPAKASNWKQIIRFNLPIKVYASTYDSDPTDSDPNEPYYFHIGKEIGLSSQEAFELTKNLDPHDSSGWGSAWFL